MNQYFLVNLHKNPSHHLLASVTSCPAQTLPLGGSSSAKAACTGIRQESVSRRAPHLQQRMRAQVWELALSLMQHTGARLNHAIARVDVGIAHHHVPVLHVRTPRHGETRQGSRTVRRAAGDEQLLQPQQYLQVKGEGGGREGLKGSGRAGVACLPGLRL